MFFRFTEEDDEQLVEFVSKHNVLYNSGLKEYRDTNVREKIWSEIAGVLCKPAKQCKSRWRSIRDHYIKQLKAKNLPTDSRPSKKRCTYWESLKFLDPFVIERRYLSNSETKEDESMTETSDTSQDVIVWESTEDVDAKASVSGSAASTSTLSTRRAEARRLSSKLQEPPPKKLKLEEENVVVEENGCEERRDVAPNNRGYFIKSSGDDVDLFFKAMAATVKKFPSSVIPEVKAQVFTVVCNMEMSLCE